MTNTVLIVGTLIVGNLGADPITRQASNETSSATLSVGTSRPKRDSEGKTFKDESDFTPRRPSGTGSIAAGQLVSSRGAAGEEAP